MKKNLIFNLMLGALCFTTLSLSALSEKPANPIKTKAASGKEPKCSCSAQVSMVSITRDSGGYITFSWSYSGAAVAFNYGGYYNTPGGGNISPGTVYGTSLTIPDGGMYGGRIGVLAVCADGTTSGSTHGILWEAGVAEQYF